MNEKLAQALDHISDQKISDAAGKPKRRHPFWIAAVAAVLALVLLILPLSEPAVTSAHVISCAEYPEMAQFPTDYESASYGNDWQAWWDDLQEQRDQPEGYADSLADFWKSSIPIFLSKEGSENSVCSPLNIYLALAMLAETANGNSQAQILDALGADNVASLRTQAEQVWDAHYLNDGINATILANSLWLDEEVTYQKSTLNVLAKKYHASSFQGDLGSGEMNDVLQSWLNEQTGGLLEDQVKNIELTQDTALALASTIYFRSKWTNGFFDGLNAEDTFHAPSGDLTTTFMHDSYEHHNYYWGENYSAISLGLEDGSAMWLILPDEGKTPADLLESGAALDLALSGKYQGSKNLKVNLSIPKFDVASDFDLNDGLKALGITEVFDETLADFSSAITDPKDIYLRSAKHAARVTIDEDGVEAAAYTVMIMDATGAPMPDEEEIDFVLDRPFLFVVTSHDDLPLFVGIVNEP